MRYLHICSKYERARDAHQVWQRPSVGPGMGAPAHHVVRWWNKYGIRICLFFKAFWDKCGFCACLLERFVSFSTEAWDNYLTRPIFPWTMKMIFQSIPHHVLLKDRKEVCKSMKKIIFRCTCEWRGFPCPNLNVVRASVDICCETWNYSPCLHVQGLSYEELWEKLNPPLRCFVRNTY